MIYIDIYIYSLQQSYLDHQADVFHGPESEYPGPPERVDTIMAFHLLYHIEDRQGFLLKCVKDWLKPNGRLLIVHDPPENSFKEVGKYYVAHMSMADRSEMVRNAIESEIRTSKMADGSHLDVKL